jgi:hypothetical protein
MVPTFDEVTFHEFVVAKAVDHNGTRGDRHQETKCRNKYLPYGFAREVLI